MITITIQAPNGTDAAHELKQMLDTLVPVTVTGSGGAKIPAASPESSVKLLTPARTAAPIKQAEVKTEAPAKRGRGRPPKAAAVESDAWDDDDTTPAPADDTDDIFGDDDDDTAPDQKTKEETMAQLEKYVAHGDNTTVDARTQLEKFGVKRFRDLPAEKYNAFFDHLQKLMK